MDYKGKTFVCCLFHADFLISLLIEREDGGDIFLQNIRCLSADYTVICQDIESLSATAGITSVPTKPKKL